VCSIAKFCSFDGDERNEAGEKKRNKPAVCYIQIVNRENTAEFDLLQRFDVNRAVVSGDFRTAEIHVTRPVCIGCIASYCME
jgi:hypothetical protein